LDEITSKCAAHQPEMTMIIIAVIAAVLLTGVMVSLLIIVQSVQAEDQAELQHKAPSRTSRAVRGLIGLRICSPEEARRCQRSTTFDAKSPAHCSQPGNS
jgi:hypothetical protein